MVELMEQDNSRSRNTRKPCMHPQECLCKALCTGPVPLYDVGGPWEGLMFKMVTDMCNHDYGIMDMLICMHMICHDYVYA